MSIVTRACPAVSMVFVAEPPVRCDRDFLAYMLAPPTELLVIVVFSSLNINERLTYRWDQSVKAIVS